MSELGFSSSVALTEKEIALKQALRKAGDTIRQLLQENAALKKKERIAVIGMSCRFPGGANSIHDYWKLLESGKNGISDVPSCRWNKDLFFSRDKQEPGKMYSAMGGFLDTSIDLFDAAFFNISPEEAKGLDPQQRLLLELCWEAIEHAGLIPDDLKSSPTGVFVGISGDDYTRHNRHSGMPERIDAYSLTGTMSGTAAGRVSKTFGFTGPSLALDTACSSSLVALHLAARSLHDLESNLALVGGVNLILDPENHIALSKLNALSPDGACRSFSADANGYVRSEGCGVIILKRESDARRDGDNILAFICGTAVNQDGKTDNFAASNGKAQQAVIRSALNEAGIRPEQLDYIETHGIGTLLEDPIELEAINKVIGDRATRTLHVGSSKSNIGHTESASGLAGLIKIVLSLQHQIIPANLHFKNPNPALDWDNLPMRVVSSHTDWPLKNDIDASRYAGLSAFGFSGTNAHVVVSGNDHPTSQKTQKSLRPMHILVLSAQTEKSLSEMAHRFSQRIKGLSSSELADVCFTSNTSRSVFNYRIAIAGSSSGSMIKKLNALKFDARFSEIQSSNKSWHAGSKSAWLFSGQGSEYAGMGKEIYQSLPTFKQTIDQCAVILDRILPVPLIDILFDQNSNHLKQTQFAHPAIFALEYSLAKMWLSWGIRPDYVAGHDIGEYVAACIAGIFTLEDGLLMLASRAKVLQSPPDHGVLTEFESFLNSIKFSAPTIPFISSFAETNHGSTATQAMYWMQHIGTPHNFNQCIRQLNQLSVRLFLEIGPDQLLINGIERDNELAHDAILFSSLKRDNSPWEIVTNTAAQLYTLGYSVDWTAFDAPYMRRKVDIPTYAFDRRSYWIDSPWQKSNMNESSEQMCSSGI